MITGLKVLSSACNCVFYRPRHTAWRDPKELNFEGLDIQKRNIPTDSAQRVDEKNGVICLVVMFASRVMAIKMSKMAHLLFSADDSKKLVTVWARYLSVTKTAYRVLSENRMPNRLWSYHS